MSFHHTNRLRDHLNPILVEGTKGNFRGNQRKLKLSQATQNILWQVASRLNEKTGSWRVSYKLLRERTGATNDTIRDSLAKLADEGFLIRVSEPLRPSNLAFSYRLGPRLECPSDCEHLEIHLTKSELLGRRSDSSSVNPSKEILERSIRWSEERSTKQSTSAPIPGTLKERRETKKKVTPCAFCRLEPESVSGIDRNLHSDNCQELARIKGGQSWRIAISNYGEEEWIGLSSKDQQRAYWVDLTKGLARNQDKLDVLDRENQKREEELLRLIGDTEILPGWSTWLRKRIETQPIKEQEFGSAVKWSRQGIDLVRGRGVWERGGYFTLEDLGAP